MAKKNPPAFTMDEEQVVEFDDVETQGPAAAAPAPAASQAMIAIPKPDNAILVAADAFAQAANSLPIPKDQKGYDVMASYHSEAKLRVKQIEEQRKKLVGPLKKAVEGVDAWFRGPRTRYEEIQEALRIPMARYVQEQEHKQRLAEAAAREEAEKKAQAQRAELEARAKEAAKKGLQETAEALNSQASMVETIVYEGPKNFKKADNQSIRKVWVFEIEDEALIPREFLTPDLKKIKAVVEGGQGGTPIPGVKQKEDVEFYAKGARA